MAYSRFTPRRRMPTRRGFRRTFRYSSASRGTGTRFVATRYSRRVPGREVPYYLGPGTEAHVFDVAIAHSATGTSSGDTSSSPRTLLNPIPRGTGIFDRESQRASMKYVLLRLRAQLNSTLFAATGNNLSTIPVTIRVMLIYATSQIAVVDPSDFIVTPNSSTTTLATAGVQRIDSRENFQILYDNKFVLRNTNTERTTAINTYLHPQGDYTFKDLDLRIPIRRPVTFTASSVSPISLSDITSGSLFLFTIMDNASGTTISSSPNSGIAASVTGSARLVFAP